jgi:hypothetical protein
MQQPVIIAKVIHGSHLFGTNTNTSDTDYKQVSLPTAEDILLRKSDRSLVVHERATAGATKNSAGDTDYEDHDLLRFTRLVASGQPVALEMLFAPDRFHQLEPHPIWRTLQENSDRIVSREAGKFLGYCRQQAIMFSLKGERMQAAEDARDYLADIIRTEGSKVRLAPYLDAMLEAFEDSEFVKEEGRVQGNGRELRHLSVCGRLVTETVMIQDALRMVEATIREYGQRARRAKQAGGHDWKALSHAVRIGHEAVELFTDGRLTLPSPVAPHLLDIKRGVVERERVTDEILEMLARVESLSATSSLPHEADGDFLDGIVMDAYAEIVEARERPERDFGFRPV